MNHSQKYSSPYLARDYFPRDILPLTLYAGRKTIRQPLPYRQHEELEFLLIREGTGTVTINARSIPVRPGTLLCLSPHHFRKIEPDKGRALEISECHVNSGIYFYVTACPYYTHTDPCVPTPPVCAVLDNALTAHVTTLMDDLGRLCQSTPISENQPAFFLLLKLFGILEEYAAEG